jgi:hypothetical protein
VMGVAAAAALLRWVPRYSDFATTGTRSRGAVVAKGPAEPPLSARDEIQSGRRIAAPPIGEPPDL